MRSQKAMRGGKRARAPRLRDRKSRPGCPITGKVIFDSELDAQGALKLIRLSVDDRKKPQRVYRCEFCGGWHLTSQEKGS